MRVERFGAATLIQADCRDVLAGQDADVILTDPVWPNCPPNSIPGWENPQSLFNASCAELPPHVRAIFVMRSDSDPRFLAGYQRLPFFRSIVLPYALPSYIGRILGGDEYAYWFGAPPKSARGRHLVPGRGPVAQPNQRPPSGHPMSRVQAHFDWLVYWATDAGETVLDPFMGSGTTGVAAIVTGRPFVGIEIHPPFFEIACRRMEAAMRQPSLLNDDVEQCA